jgi:hypothetical protein
MIGADSFAGGLDWFAATIQNSGVLTNPASEWSANM